MPVHRLDHINLRAAGREFAALREFYRGILGLAVGARPALESAGLWLYGGGAPLVHLVEASEQSRVPAAASGPGTALDHVAFGCTGLEEMLGRLERLGVAKLVRAQSATGQILLRLEDPCGLRVELVFAADEEAARLARSWGV